ncbi:uncharacterized protein LOC144513687 [Sander vitreus]
MSKDFFCGCNNIPDIDDIVEAVKAEDFLTDEEITLTRHTCCNHHHRSPATHTCQPSTIKHSTSTPAQQTISAESLSPLHRVHLQTFISSQLASPFSPPTAPCFTLPPSPRPASSSLAPLLPCSSASSSGLQPRFPRASPSSLAILVPAAEFLASFCSINLCSFQHAFKSALFTKTYIPYPNAHV